MTIQETLEQEVTPPVVVHTSPLPDQGWAFVRQITPLVTAYLVTSGYIDGRLEQIISLLVGVGLPIIWGQLKTRLRALQLSTIEKKVDDRILTTKAKVAAG